MLWKDECIVKECYFSNMSGEIKLHRSNIETQKNITLICVFYFYYGKIQYIGK